jgi:hypothetical protein
MFWRIQMRTDQELETLEWRSVAPKRGESYA